MRFKNLKDLEYSRIFFDKEPPAFVKYFVIFILSMLIVFGYISTITPKNYIVKGQGTIQYSDKVYIASTANGKISEIFKKEGEEVKKGELILKLSSGTEKTQTNEINKQIELIEKQLEVLDKYKKSLDQKSNYLENSGMEQAYYGKVEYFLGEVKKNNESLKTTEEKIKNEQNEINVIKQSIQKLESDQASDEEIKAEKEKLKAAQEQLTNSQNELKSIPTQTINTYNQLISEAGAEKNQLESKKTENIGQMNVSSSNDNSLNIYASSNGKISYMIPQTSGYFVQNGAMIATVSGNTESYLIAKTYILAQERAKVKQGDKVLINVEGLNDVKYQAIEGKLEIVGTEAIVLNSNSQNQQQLYELTISLSKTKLNDFELYNGLPVISSTIYDSETYADYILKKLSLK